MDFGWLRYVALAALLALFWKHGGGRSLDALLERDMAFHHQVHRVLEKHPAGGTWRQTLAWMREDALPRSKGSGWADPSFTDTFERGQ